MNELFAVSDQRIAIRKKTSQRYAERRFQKDNSTTEISSSNEEALGAREGDFLYSSLDIICQKTIFYKKFGNFAIV